MVRVLTSLPSDFSPQELSWSERRFHSPDLLSDAVYREPWEFRMGAYAWGFDLQERGNSILPEHPFLASSPQIGMLHCPTDLAPWSPDGLLLGFLSWEQFSAFLYSIPRKASISLTVSPPPLVTLKWSPTHPILAVAHNDHCLIFDSQGSHICKASWRANNRTSPYLFWWPDRPIILTLATPPHEDPPELLAFSALTGELESATNVNPAEILPFDQEAFRTIPRDGYSLLLDPATRGVGSLLYSWHSPVFDPITFTLHLATYRPTAPPSRKDEGLVCPVREAWASIRPAA